MTEPDMQMQESQALAKRGSFCDAPQALPDLAVKKTETFRSGRQASKSWTRYRGSAKKRMAHQQQRQRMKTTRAMKMAMIGIAILISGCAPKSPYLPKEYDPAVSARLRVYFGTATTIVLNRTCQDGMLPYGFEANDPLVRGFSNTVIGMPMPDIDEEYYSEYVVTAGIPIDIYSRGGGWSHPNAIGMSMYSRPFGEAISAVLEPGKDYETLYQHPNTVLRELFVADGVVRTRPAAVKKFEKCDDNVKVERKPLPMGGNS